MSDKLEFIKNNIMQKMFDHKMSWPFHDPVDPVALNIPNYFEVIKKPICMGDIKKKLDNNEYNDADECLADFELMFKNCYEYNSPGYRIFDMARKLQAFLKRQLRELATNEEGRNKSSSTKKKQKRSTTKLDSSDEEFLPKTKYKTSTFRIQPKRSIATTRSFFKEKIESDESYCDKGQLKVSPLKIKKTSKNVLYVVKSDKVDLMASSNQTLHSPFKTTKPIKKEIKKNQNVVNNKSANYSSAKKQTIKSLYNKNHSKTEQVKNYKGPKDKFDSTKRVSKLPKTSISNQKSTLECKLDVIQTESTNENETRKKIILKELPCNEVASKKVCENHVKDVKVVKASKSNTNTYKERSGFSINAIFDDITKTFGDRSKGQNTNKSNELKIVKQSLEENDATENIKDKQTNKVISKVGKDCLKQTNVRSSTNENDLTKNGRVSPRDLQHGLYNRVDKMETVRNVQNYQLPKSTLPTIPAENQRLREEANRRRHAQPRIDLLEQAKLNTEFIKEHGEQPIFDF